MDRKSNILNPEDKSLEESGLRPLSLDEFIGQQEILSNLKIFITAAKNRDGALDHVLLSGPPGLGKTTLAQIISKELGSQFLSTSSQVISKGADIAKFLTLMENRDVFFIDEIHGLPRNIEELLYPAMEDYKIDYVVGDGITSQAIQIPLKPFTLIGATTRSGMISEPMKGRFGIHLRLDYYNDADMQKIVVRSAKIMNVLIEPEAALEIGKRSRKTPRIANNLLRRVRDFSEVEGKNTIDLQICRYALLQLGVDNEGLDEIDRKILTCLIERYKGGPVGLKPIAVILGEEERTLEDTYEPYLVREGFINRTPSGRIAAKKSYEHLKLMDRYEKQLF